jgi:hypothetical protein
LNSGTWLVGLADSRSVASGRLPPSVQALTTHSAVCPCWMLASEFVRLTHRLVRGDVAAPA